MPKVMKKKRKVKSAVDELTPLKPPTAKSEMQQTQVPLLSLSLSVSAMAAQMVDMANRVAELERAVMLHNQQIHQVVATSNETIGLLKAQVADLQQVVERLVTGGRPAGAIMGAAQAAPGAVGPAVAPAVGNNQAPRTLRPVPQPGNAHTTITK